MALVFDSGSQTMVMVTGFNGAVLNTDMAAVGALMLQMADVRDDITWFLELLPEQTPDINTTTQIRIQNDDNTFTNIVGSGFPAGEEPLTGTVTNVQLLDTDGVSISPGQLTAADFVFS